MAYTNTAHVTPLRQIARTHGWLSTLRTAIARRATYHRTVRELSALSTRELADLGMDRGMITRVATEAAYGN